MLEILQAALPVDKTPTLCSGTFGIFCKQREDGVAIICDVWLPVPHVVGRAQLQFRSDRGGDPDLNVS